MLDEVTCSVLDALPRGSDYQLSLEPNPDAGMLALMVSIDGEPHAVGIAYENEHQFEADREQIGAYLIERKQKSGCGGCGSCRCG